MNGSNQKKILLLIIGFLLLANAVTLYWLYDQNKGGGKERKKNLESFLRSDIGYNDRQMEAYDSLHRQFKHKADSLHVILRQDRSARFKYLSAHSYSASSIDSAAASTAQRQKMAEVGLLEHIREVRSLGSPYQQRIFDSSFVIFIAKDKKRKKH